MTICMHLNCTNTADRAIKIMAPALGVPEALQTPLEVWSELLLCHHHAKNLTPLQVMQPATMIKIIEMNSDMHKIPPDFSRAKVVAVPLDDPGYLAASAKREKIPQAPKLVQTASPDLRKPPHLTLVVQNDTYEPSEEQSRSLKGDDK